MDRKDIRNTDPYVRDADPHLRGCTHLCKNISWRAIITAALIGVGLGFLLNLFVVAIGLSAFTTDREGLGVLVWGGYIGLLIGTIAVTYATGYVAGFMGWPSCGHRNWGLLYGFAAWCLALLIAVLLGGQFDRYVSNYANFVARPSAEAIVGNNPMNKPAAIASTNDNRTGSVANVRSESEVNRMGAVTFMLFVLFFIGALASTIGGYFGSVGRERCEERCATRNHI